jgi:hypothetical protein
MAAERILAAVPPSAGATAPAGFAEGARGGTLPGSAGHVAERRDAGAWPAATGRDQLGVHAEWSAEGIRVWLRAAPELDPGHVVAELVRALLPRLSARGARLLTVVCNGRVAWTATLPDASEPYVPEPPPTPPHRQEHP